MSTKSRKSSWDYMTSGSFMNSSTSTRKLVPNVDDQTQSNKRRTAVVLTNLDDHLIETEEEKLELYSIEDIRLKTKKFMTHSKFGLYYENALLVLSVFSSLEFIYQTYLEQNNEADQNLLDTLNSMEKVLAIIFMIDWSLNYFCADHKLIFVTSFFSMVDILTVVPIWITDKYNHIPDMRDIDNFKTAMLYIAFGLSTTRILRALRIRRKLLYIEDAVDRCVGEICLVVSVMLLFNSAVMQFLEVDQDLGFHTWMYYIWVTTTTVGYGDVLAITVLGRMAVMAMIAFAIIIVPKMTNELIEKMNLQSVYARANYFPKSRFSKHIVIIGDLTSTSIKDFFAELFHEDHENGDLSAVMLIPDYPTFELIMLLRSPEYFLSLTYLEGSALVDKDLTRAKVSRADAIFVMCNKFSFNPDEEDAKSILQGLSIKRYLSNQAHGLRNPNLFYVMQLIRPENRKHIVKDESIREIDKGSVFTKDNDIVVCLNEIKMGIVGKSLIFPGCGTLIMNLITSFSEDGEAKDEDEAINWLTEYEQGCDWEIYVTELSDGFVGARFCDLAYGLYEKLGVVLFALQVFDAKLNNMQKLYLNPADFIIPSRGRYRVEAFVIAKNMADSDLSFSNNDHDAPYLKTKQAMHDVMAHVTSLPSLAREASKANNNVPLFSMDKYLLAPFKRQVAPEVPTTKKKRESKTSVSKKDRVAVKTSKSMWAKMKKKNIVNKTIENFSMQEKVQQIEDRNFLRDYFTRPTPAPIQSVTITTSVVEELPHMNKHLIVIGKDLSNLFDLIKTLRARSIGYLRWIVILYPQDIPFDVWDRISRFEAIYYVRGSSLEEKHLRRAGIYRAKKVVVMGDGQINGSGAGHKGNEALVDADAIFTYQCVKRMNPDIECVCEIVNHENIAYLETGSNNNTSDEGKAFEYKTTSLFASGTLFTTMLLDSLVCQSHYNSQIIKVVDKLISGSEENSASQKDVRQLAKSELENKLELENQEEEDSSIDGGSDSSDSSSDESDKSSVDHPENKSRQQNPGKGRRASVANDKILYNTSIVNGIQGSCLYQIPVPVFAHGRTYKEMFQHLSTQGMVPLGLLRGLVADMPTGPRQNRAPYVYTNPSKDAVLYPCDSVFVLSTQPIQSPKSTSIADLIGDLKILESTKELSATKGVNPLTGLEGPEKEQFQALDARVSKIASENKKNFKDIMSALQGIQSHLGLAPTTPPGPSPHTGQTHHYNGHSNGNGNGSGNGNHDNAHRRKFSYQSQVTIESALTRESSANSYADNSGNTEPKWPDGIGLNTNPAGVSYPTAAVGNKNPSNGNGMEERVPPVILEESSIAPSAVSDNYTNTGTSTAQLLGMQIEGEYRRKPINPRLAPLTVNGPSLESIVTRPTSAKGRNGRVVPGLDTLDGKSQRLGAFIEKVSESRMRSFSEISPEKKDGGDPRLRTFSDGVP